MRASDRRRGSQGDPRRVRRGSSGSDADTGRGERRSEHPDTAGHPDRQVHETSAGRRAIGHGSDLHIEGILNNCGINDTSVNKCILLARARALGRNRKLIDVK